MYPGDIVHSSEWILCVTIHKQQQSRISAKLQLPKEILIDAAAVPFAHHRLMGAGGGRAAAE